VELAPHPVHVAACDRDLGEEPGPRHTEIAVRVFYRHTPFVGEENVGLAPRHGPPSPPREEVEQRNGGASSRYHPSEPTVLGHRLGRTSDNLVGESLARGGKIWEDVDAPTYW
jgi:hypothetical protein